MTRKQRRLVQTRKLQAIRRRQNKFARTLHIPRYINLSEDAAEGLAELFRLADLSRFCREEDERKERYRKKCENEEL